MKILRQAMRNPKPVFSLVPHGTVNDRTIRELASASLEHRRGAPSTAIALVSTSASQQGMIDDTRIRAEFDARPDPASATVTVPREIRERIPAFQSKSVRTVWDEDGPINGARSRVSTDATRMEIT